MPEKPVIRLALVDDHLLFRKVLITHFNIFCSNFTILFEADNGLDLQNKISKYNEPDIILMDIMMPEMNGIDAVKWLNLHFPCTKILVITMFENEENIIQMLRLGVKGYLCKNSDPKVLADAVYTINDNRFYYTNFITNKLIQSLQTENNSGKEKEGYDEINTLTNSEKNFLTLACSELTYNEIAAQMYRSLKTIEGYQKSLFQKLKVKNRVGLVLYAIKKGLVKLKD